MVKVALFVLLEAKPGKEKAVENFLLDGLPLVEEANATKLYSHFLAAAWRLGK